MLPRWVRDEISRVVAGAAKATAEDWASGAVEDEPAMSSRLATRIQDGLNELDLGEYEVHADVRTLGDRGRGAAENRYGADLAIVLRVDTSDTSTTKGLLVQAKRSGRDGVRMTGQQRKRVQVGPVSRHLRQQNRKMLRITPHSYIWVYDCQRPS